MARRPLLTGAPSGVTTPLVGVVITALHVYLPLDEAGNGRADWRDAGETVRVDKRARLNVPADLATFLSDRDQAEILSTSLEAGLSTSLEAGLR